MTEWPLEIDAQEYHPLPESWVEHGIDDRDPDGPQLLAVSAGTFRNIIRVRYAHPRYDSVGEMRFPGTGHNDGLVPEGLPDSWPRSVGAAALDPVDIRRKPEQQHLETLWADRVDDVLEEVEPRFTSDKIVADGGERDPPGAFVDDWRARHGLDEDGDGGGSGGD
jgi:hypothetical protein